MWYLIIIIALLAVVAYMWYSNSQKSRTCGCKADSETKDVMTKPGEPALDVTPEEVQFNRSPIVPSSVTF